MSLDAPAYIVSLQNNIRARPISWEGAVRAKTITDEDLKKIKAIDKVRKEQRKATIEGDVQTYTDLLLGNAEGTKSIFESAAKRPDILQYMLVLTGDLVDGMQIVDLYHEVAVVLTEHYRHSSPDTVAHQAHAPLQAILAAAEAVQQSGRPDTASHILGPIVTSITRRDCPAEVEWRDR